ncbi:hypothetical protein BC829DRAFT_171110 [Chytridium lagenaria]|nr:hypothetical protein BC829DRAFT_171110 [Chytridium lagenaria]
MSLLQRGNQLRRIRIPVGGWPSGIMFGMGMRPTDVTETVPPGGAARNTSMAMAMNAAFTAIHAEAVAKAKAAEEVQAKGVEHESEMLDDNVEEMEQEQDEEEEVLRVKLEGHKNTRQDAGAGSALPSLETANTNNLSASTSSRVPSKLEPIHPGSSKTVTFETPAVCQKHPPRPPTSMARLEPINIPSPPELQQPLRPVTPSSYASPLPPPSHPATSLPSHLKPSNTVTAPPQPPTHASLQSPRPKPTPRSPPSSPESTVSNPAFLPDPLSATVASHSRSLNPAYLLQLATHPRPQHPRIPLHDDYCASPVGANVHGIPSKYLAAFNAVAAVNGLPQAIGTPSQPIADPKMHVPVTTASIAAATGWGVNAIPVHKDPSNGRDCRGVPAMGVPALCRGFRRGRRDSGMRFCRFLDLSGGEDGIMLEEITLETFLMVSHPSQTTHTDKKTL